jgi:hypothetical protein
MLLTLSRIPRRAGEQLCNVDILGALDEAGHRFHLPMFFQGPVCDAWDWHLGVYDDDDTEMHHEGDQR